MLVGTVPVPKMTATGLVSVEAVAVVEGLVFIVLVGLFPTLPSVQIDSLPKCSVPALAHNQGNAMKLTAPN